LLHLEQGTAISRYTLLSRWCTQRCARCCPFCKFSLRTSIKVSMNFYAWLRMFQLTTTVIQC